MFTPTPEELELLAEVLTFTGTEASRILPTEKAIDVFERSDLGRNDLKEIWRFADKDRNGMLTSMELAVALRLIGWVQAGEELSDRLIDLPGPLPTLKGISDVERRQGPPVIPQELSPRKQHTRSPSLPFPARQTHTLTGSTESLPAPSLTPLTPTPPPPSGRSEPAPPLSPLDKDDINNPLISLPPNAFQTIASLSTPSGSVRRRARAKTIDNSSSAPTPPPPVVPTPAPVPPPPPPPPNPAPAPHGPHLQHSPPVQTFSPTPPPDGPSSDDPVAESPAQPEQEPDATTSTITKAQTPTIPSPQPLDISVQVDDDEVPLAKPSQPSLPEVNVDEVPEASAEADTVPDPAPPEPEDPSHLEADVQEIQRLSEQLAASNLRAMILENQLVEMEMSTLKLMSANDLELAQLKAQHVEAKTRISELEGFEKEYRETAALVETLTRDLHEMKTEKDALKQEMQAQLDAKDKEIMDLEKRASEAAEESQALEKGNAVAVQRLTAEGHRLTRRLEEREEAFAKEKAELEKRVEEVQAIAAELQWVNGEDTEGVQQALQDATRENDSLKRQVQELQVKVLQQQQQRSQHELEVSRLHRQLVEARREHSGGLDLDIRAPRQHRMAEIQSDPPPPAYDDALFVR